MQPSRRAFLGTVAAATVLSCGTRASRAKEARTFPAGTFVDMHTHLGQVWNTVKELTADDLLKWMDANDVSQAVVLPLASPESSSFLLTSDFVLEATKPHRDRLIPFCSLDPRTSLNGGKQATLDVLRRWIDKGAKGFGEHKAGLAFDNPLNMRIYDACGEVKLPLLFHLDNLRNWDTPDLAGVERALQANPHTTFIGHGPGWWAGISGDCIKADMNGYPKRPVTADGAIDRLMDKYPNIYGEISAGSGNQALARDLTFAREFLIRRADRIMFGTDYLSPGQEVPQFETMKKLNLPTDVAAKVYRDNARKLCGLLA